MTTETDEDIGTGYEYDAPFQKKVVGLTLKDTVFVQRTDGLINPKFLENDADAFLVTMVQDFYGKYRKVPDFKSYPVLLKAAFADRKVPEPFQKEVIGSFKEAMKGSSADRDFIIDTIADFAKNKAIEMALLRSAELVGKKDYGTIEKLMRQALDVGANDAEASAYDYVDELKARTEYRKALLEGKIKPNGITTGIEDLDKHLYHHGWGRSELSCLMARAKFGKSMGLGDFGKNAWLAGYNVLIATCETSANIYADRIDANLSETAMDLLKHKPGIVEKLIREQAERTKAQLKIHDFPSGTLKVSQLRRLVQWYRQVKDIRFDLIVVDYADIMAAEHPTGVPREDSRMIWIDLRALMQEEKCAGLTATQTNRAGAAATVATATDVAEDYNKVRTVDLMISGNATDAELAAGKARLHFAASRNQKEMTLEIQQDRNTMRFLKRVLRVIS